MSLAKMQTDRTAYAYEVIAEVQKEIRAFQNEGVRADALEAVLGKSTVQAFDAITFAGNNSERMNSVCGIPFVVSDTPWHVSVRKRLAAH